MADINSLFAGSYSIIATRLAVVPLVNIFSQHTFAHMLSGFQALNDMATIANAASDCAF